MLVPLSVNICRYVISQVLMALNTKEECGLVDRLHHFQETSIFGMEGNIKAAASYETSIPICRTT
jgi:hypothetical protein